MKEMYGLQVLERSDINHFAPSFYTKSPKADVSDKYEFLDSATVAKSLWDEGWMPTYARESRANKESNNGFVKHMVRFAHPDFVFNNERIELLAINSHNRSAAFQFHAGVFRFVCLNGMVVKSEDFGNFSIKHIGTDVESQVLNAVNGLAKSTKLIGEKIERFKDIELTQDEQGAFSRAIHRYVYGDEHGNTKDAPFEATALLGTRRTVDEAKDIWTTTNVIQENLIKGGIKGKGKTGRRMKSRAITSIDKDVKLNQALWRMADELSELVS